MKNDAVLEEMWQIKRELSAADVSWDEYAKALFQFQDMERAQGVRFLA